MGGSPALERRKIVKIIHGIDAVLDRVEKWCVVFLLLALTFIIFIQVILRAVGVPLSWSDEASRLCFIWCIYIGAIHASRYGKHLKIDIVASLVKNETFSSILTLIENLAVIAFLVLFIPVGFGLVQKFMASGQRSPVIHYNVAVGYAAPAIFFLFGTIRHVENIFREIQKMVQRKKGTTREEGGAL